MAGADTEVREQFYCFLSSAPENFFLNQYGTGQNLSQSVSRFRFQYLFYLPTKRLFQVQPCEKFGHRFPCILHFVLYPLLNNPGLLKDMGKTEVKGKVGEYIGS